MKKLNKFYPMSPLNLKLREVYDIKQKINNSQMSDDAKTIIMKECDRQINQFWRWSYENKPGYEIKFLYRKPNSREV